MGNLKKMTGRASVIKEDGTVYPSRNFTNSNAVSNLITYVIDPGQNPYRTGTLLYKAAYGAVDYLSTNDCIQQFEYVQNNYGIKNRKGKRMYYEIFNMYEKDIQGDSWKLTPEDLIQIANECALVFYHVGHQVVYGLYQDTLTHYSIHFAVNSINFRDGYKWKTNMEDVRQREYYFNEIVRMHQMNAMRRIQPHY